VQFISATLVFAGDTDDDLLCRREFD